MQTFRRSHGFLKANKSLFAAVIKSIIFAHVVLALRVQGIIGLAIIICVSNTKQGIIVHIKAALILGNGVNQSISRLLTGSETMLIQMVKY